MFSVGDYIYYKDELSEEYKGRIIGIDKRKNLYEVELFLEAFDNMPAEVDSIIVSSRFIRKADFAKAA